MNGGTKLFTTYRATSGTVGAFKVDTLAARLLLDSVSIVLPDVIVDVWLGRVHDLAHRLHFPPLALSLLVHVGQCGDDPTSSLCG